MKHLSKLLATNNSDLAWVLRLGLHGLRTQLLTALETSATDPGRENCEELLKELDVFLQANIPSSNISPTVVIKNNPPWEDILEPIPAALQPEKSLKVDNIEPQLNLEEIKPEKLKLEKIAYSLLCDRDISNYIGEYQICSKNDAQLWDEIQYLLLRVPEKIASIRQKKIFVVINIMCSCEH